MKGARTGEEVGVGKRRTMGNKSEAGRPEVNINGVSKERVKSEYTDDVLPAVRNGRRIPIN